MTRKVRSLVLVTPPVLHAPLEWCRPHPGKPHLASLAGFVRDLAEVRLLDLEGDRPQDLAGRVEEVLIDARPDLVGISCWTSLHYLGARVVARRIRETRPDLPIVVGGHHASAVPSDFSDSEGLFDYVVRGDGEHALRTLCEELPRRPPGARVVRGAPYDMSDPSHIDWERYPWCDESRRVLWLHLGRGCRFGCGFCMEPLHRGRRSAYPVGDALGILEGLARTHAPRVVCLADPLFGADRRWTEEFLEGLEARRLPMMFWGETRTDVMTPSLLDRLRACRFKVDFGLDTGSEAMVERMGKSASPRTYLGRSLETLRHADEIGLTHDIYLMFNHPGETPETARESMEFAESLVDDGRHTCARILGQTFFFCPGTATYDRRDEHRRKWGTEIRHPDWWRRTGDQHALATDVLPSRAFRGREEELTAFRRWQEEVNADRQQRYPLEVARFRHEFYGE